MVTRAFKERRWSLIVLYIAILALSIYAAVRAEQVNNNNQKVIKEQQHLISENRHRLQEIQQQRITSCILTYESFLDVFDPFLPKNPEGAEKKRIDDFHNIIEKKQAHCIEQVQQPPKER